MTGTPAEETARELLLGQPAAALGTLMEGAPYVSLVLVGRDADGAPLLLLSDLAQHSRNLAADPRVSLLFDGTADRAERLTGARLTVVGTAARHDGQAALARFLARHPSAEAYAGFADFHLYRVEMNRGQLVAGFGRIEWIDGEILRRAGASA
jgi:putative heme iron utilization protein